MRCGNTLTFAKGATFEVGTLDMGDPSPGQERISRPLPLKSVLDGAPQLSPDCQWLAYVSNESGRRQVFVSDFPSLANRHQISTDVGNEPLWNPNPGKRQLFYRSGDRVMEVDITDHGTAAEDARELFRGPYATAANAAVRPNYDVSPDGERFLMLKPVERAPLTQIKVVRNWHEELKRRVPAN